MKKATFQFENFVVTESHIVFRKPGDYSLKIDIEPKGHILKKLNQFHLEMKVIVSGGDDEFKVTLQTMSVFSFPKDANLSAYKSSFFTINAPAITFPYIRAYIGALTTLSGLPPLMLPTLNMVAVGERLKTNIEI